MYTHRGCRRRMWARMRLRMAAYDAGPSAAWCTIGTISTTIDTIGTDAQVDHCQLRSACVNLGYR
jgi:hypothetical protein